MQVVVGACADRRISDSEVACVISNNSQSGALRFARSQSIPNFHLSSKTHPDPEVLDQEFLSVLKASAVDLIVLAGYMRKLPARTLDEYRGRILNIHPALLPKYGGKGMYGIAVHEAVIASGEQEAGVTIHLVDEEYDHGPVVAQTKVPVLDGDTPESLRERVLSREHDFLVETLSAIASGHLKLESVGFRLS